MSNTLSQLLSTLNDEQYAAVHPHNATMLVCAGAGSGKTRIIIARIAYLLEQGVPPEQIVAVTFTNKASREMKDRLATLCPHISPLPYIGTFHSFCLYTLKKYRSVLGINDFSLLDETDQRKLVHTILKRSQLEKEYQSRSVLGYISHRKNMMYSNHESTLNETLEQVYHAYEQEKTNAQCYDFDDLLLNTVTYLRNNHTFRQTLHSFIHHILVDEYQDTNHIQHELLKLLAHEDGATRTTSLCVVGDEDQSIYRWRGATVENFTAFHHDFPETQRITITQNYRSCHPILQAANTVIQHNEQRYEKMLWSQRPGKDRILLAHCASHKQEAQLIAYAAHHVLQSGHQPAILYRSHYQSRAIEEALVQHNIGYRIIGGTEFYQRQEIKDILAYMRLLANPYDHVSWMRICNVPSRSLGAKFQEQFMTEWRNTPFADHITMAERIQSQLTPQKRRSLEGFINLFDNLSPHDAAYDACKSIIDQIRYREHLTNTYEEREAQEKIENINELQRALSIRTDVSVRTFLEEITLMQNQQDQHTEEQQAQLMTLHAAKGLEFHTVILAGLEENVFPSTRSRYDDSSLEEERRLFYVGLTRAQERVIVTYARYRATFGTINDNPSSRFIAELPDNLIRHEDMTWMFDTHLRDYIQEWFTGSSSTPTHDISRDSGNDRPSEPDTHHDTKWKHGQAVWHPTFGRGFVVGISNQSSDQTRLTVQFSGTSKKLDARYVERV